MLAATTLPTWLDFSTLAGVVTGVVIGAVAVAVLSLALVRGLVGKALLFSLAVGIAATGVWYRGSMTDSRRTCSTTLFRAHVRTPGCQIH